MNSRILVAIAVSVMIAGCSQSSDDAGESRISVEQMFAGGLIYDGSGSAPFLADLGISAGKIVFIGDAESAGVQSDEAFDVAGHWVTPGFIDAHSHRLPDRGYLREGYVADITILDPDRYRDKPTFEQPLLYAEGVAHLLVKGTFAIRDGKTTGALAGMPLARPRAASDSL